MGLFNFGNKGTQAQQPVQQPVDTTPRPLGQAVQNAQGVWEQDYEVWNGNSWVVEKYLHNGTEWVKAPRVSIDLTKDIPNTTSGISLRKSVISLDKSLVDLTKKSGINFGEHRAKVAVVMDYSGSMSELYRTGAVQNLLTRLMPLALRFDDNGELDVWLFTGTYKRLSESMDLHNFETYVKKVAEKSGFRMGGTSYAPVLKDVLHKYFVEDAATSDIPTFVIFVTDGSNADKKETNATVIESANHNIFIQFVGIGSAYFDYLEKLDDLKGRPVDNTGFIKVSDMSKLSDEALYDKLLDQYPDWLKAKGLR